MPTPATGSVKVPKLEPIPWVAVKLSTGQVVLRHPDEVKKPVGK
jgi:hypothetical protein